MAFFEYSGRDRSGALIKGSMDAGNADDVASSLFGNSITPINIKEVRREQKAQRSRQDQAKRENVAPKEKVREFVSRNKVDIDELIVFSRQMYSLTKAGLPLDRSIKGLQGSMTNRKFSRVLSDIVKSVQSGMDLAGAMARHPRIFSQLYLSLIHVGENTGRLDQAFREIGKYLEMEKLTTKRIKGATRYPMFVLFVMLIAIGVITVFVIPVFRDTFESFGADLPWQTSVLINSSDFVLTFWPMMLVILFGSITGFISWTNTPWGRLSWDRRKLHLPIAGSILKRIALGRFARTFSLVQAAGLPIVQGLVVVAGAVGNAFVARHVDRMREGVERGETLFVTAKKTRMFSSLVLQMIAVGEESGQIDELLGEVADFYDAEVEYDISRISQSIEPILIVFISGLVLILALGVFLPIWDLNTAIN